MENFNSLLEQLNAHEVNYIQLNNLQSNQDVDVQVSQEYLKCINTLIEEFPAYVGLNAVFLKRYQQHHTSTKSLDKIQQALQAYEKCLTYQQNISNLQLWQNYVDFLNHLSDVYSTIPGENVNTLESKREESHKQVLERALNAVGLYDMESSNLWESYIDFEITQNNMHLVNLLCFMAIETPLRNSQKIKEKYFQIINTNYESIFNSINATDAEKDVSERNVPKFKEILRKITEDFQGDKEKLKEFIQKKLIEQDQDLKQRVQFENQLTQSKGNHAQIKSIYQKYIQFELSKNETRRAQYLYERALGSSLSFENDIQFWLNYVQFIQDQLKDVTLVKAKFEQKIQQSKLLSNQNKIEVMIENAKSEEVHNNPQRARKIYEQLDQDIASGLLKTRMARINFEKRQGNMEKVRELFFESFSNAIQKEDKLAVTYIATQYSRFIQRHFNDNLRAIEIFKQAIQSQKCANKVLYLSYVNLIRSHKENQNQYETIKGIFDKALDQLDALKLTNPQEYEDMKEIAQYYLAFMEEEVKDNQQLKDLQTLKKKLGERGLQTDSSSLIKNLVNGQELGGIGRKRQNTESVYELENQNR